MIWLYITLGVIAFLLSGYIVSYYIVNHLMFDRFFRRDDPKKIIDLDSKAYDDYRDQMLSARERMEKVPCERLSITSFDGLKLSARYYRGNGDKLIIMCHGAHTYSLNNFAVMAEKMAQKGYSMLIIDQRAYGESEGEYVSYGALEQYDLLKWIELTEKFDYVRSIVLYGISMGASTVAFASDKIKDERVKGMILESGFSSLGELERSLTGMRRLPDFLFSLQKKMAKRLIGVEFAQSNVDSLKKTDIPALFIWGDNDIVTPLKDFKVMYEECASQKRLVVVPGAGHAVATVAGGDNVQNLIFDFIENNFKGE